MSRNLLAEAINTIKVGEIAGKRECEVKYSKLIGEVLRVMKEHNYIGDYEFIDDGKGGKFRVKLIGKINDAKSINPRSPVKADEWYIYEARYLPAVGIGILIVTTPQGVMTNIEAQKRKIGGRLLAYVY